MFMYFIVYLEHYRYECGRRHQTAGVGRPRLQDGGLETKVAGFVMHTANSAYLGFKNCSVCVCVCVLHIETH